MKAVAWLINNKATNECSPVVHQSAATLDALKRLNSYGDAHPELFPIKMAYSRHGVAIPRDTLPMEASVECSAVRLPDILAVGDIAISARLKNAIESVEPNIHTFYPIQIKCLKGDEAVVEYYLLVAGHAIYEQVDLDATTQARKKAPDVPGASKVVAPTSADGRKIAIFRNRSNGWHLWWSWDIHFNLTISNELKAAIDSAGLRCLEFTELLETNEEKAS